MAIHRHRHGYPYGANANFGASLDAAIASYWKMDEVGSVVRVDSKGTNNLAVTGTVNDAAGKINQGLTFDGTAGNMLSIADNATLRVGATPFGFWAWVQVAVLAGNKEAIIKGSGTTAATLAYHLFWFGAGPFFRVTMSNGAGNSAVDISPTTFPTLPPIAITTWYLVYGGWDGTGVYGGINNLDAATGGKFTLSGPTAILDSATFPFCVGQSALNTNRWTGLIDEVGFIQTRALTSVDVNLIYAAGAGKQYPYA